MADAGDAPGAEQIAALGRVSRGEQGVDELAATLAGLPPMIVPLPPAEAARFLGGLPSDPSLATSTMKWSDLPQPEPFSVESGHGTRTPLVFTSHEAANAFVRDKGLVTGESAWLSLTRPWADGLREFLSSGYDGVIIDEGTDRRIALARNELARLYAVLTLEVFADLPTLWVVAVDGHLHRQPGPDGEGWITFVFDGAAVAEAGLKNFALPAGATVTAPEIDTFELLGKMSEAGVDRLVVNPSFGTERTYGAAEMAAMLARLGARAPRPPAPVPAPAPVAAPANDEVPAILARARAGTAPAPAPAVARAGDEGHAFWLALYAQLEGGKAPKWQVAERVAFEMDLHVEIDPRRADGLRWPAFYNMKEDRPTTAFVFTGAARAAEYVAKVAGGREFLAMAGIEAIRWLVSAPGKIAHVAIDAGETEGGRNLVVAALADALFPMNHAIGDLRRVPAVGLDRVGSLPGARGLKPEVVRALTLGWRNLVGFKEPRTVGHAGRTWIPIASSVDAFFASLPREAGRVAPDPAGKEPPFARWLGVAAGCDGLLLDATSTSPLALEPTDLVVLGLWAAHPDRQPTTGEVVAEVARLVQQGTLTATQAGRIAADLPDLWIVLRERPPQVEMMMFPDTDALLLFTSEAAASAYLRLVVARWPSMADFHPGSARCAWTFHPLLVALESYTEAWLDPVDPAKGGGLRLSNEALRAGVARLDETLRPRVPGFVV